MQAALDHGAIPKKIKAIPINKLMSELKSLSALFIPTENIIRGILNKRTITLPIEKFVLFNKFIDAEIEPKQDKINDPIIKVKIKFIKSGFIFLISLNSGRYLPACLIIQIGVRLIGSFLIAFSSRQL